ncbi:MAG: hypothetical protein ACRYG2_37425 [Janthinobacterium lividum]
MVTVRRTGVLAALGVAAVVVGILVLRSPGARAGIGWFSYDGPPSPELLEALVAWNLTRTVGALLVLAGLLVLAHLLGALAASRGSAVSAPLTAGVLVLAGVLVVGGLVAFVVLDVLGSREGSTSRQLGLASSVWTRSQTSAALVVATGLVLGAMGGGLRRRTAPERVDELKNTP